MCRRRGGGGVGGGDGDGDDDEEREEDEVDDGAPAEATRRAGPFGAGQAEPLADEGETVGARAERRAKRAAWRWTGEGWGEMRAGTGECARVGHGDGERVLSSSRVPGDAPSLSSCASASVRRTSLISRSPRIIFDESRYSPSRTSA